jgi:hypothetical protein
MMGDALVLRCCISRCPSAPTAHLHTSLGHRPRTTAPSLRSSAPTAHLHTSLGHRPRTTAPSLRPSAPTAHLHTSLGHRPRTTAPSLRSSAPTAHLYTSLGHRPRIAVPKHPKGQRPVPYQRGSAALVRGHGGNSESNTTNAISWADLHHPLLRPHWITRAVGPQ